jgi:fluoride exporter
MNGPVWLNFGLVALGGAFGTSARYAVGLWVLDRFGPLSWPWATFSINILGSLLIGVVAGLSLTGAWGVGPGVRTVLAIGVLGGFTTFSAFSLELNLAVQSGRTLTALAYACASVVLGFLAASGGFALARLVR